MLSVLIGGVVADRVPQRYILLTVEVVRGIGFGAAAVLSLTGLIQIWQLALIAFVLGIADGFFYPAYSAWLPALIAPEQLLAANGIEGVLRPTIMQAAGPALASVIIAVWSPGCRVRWWSPCCRSARPSCCWSCGPPRCGGTWTRDRASAWSAR